MADEHHHEKPYPWLSHYPDGVSWFAALPDYPVTQLLEETARRFPKRACIDFLDYRLTYAEVANLVNRAACGLQKLGVNKGTRVGLLLPNTPYSIVFYYAILKAGGVVVNLNPLYAIRELEHHIQDSGMEMAITLDLKLTFDKIFDTLKTTSLKRVIVCRLAEALPFPMGLLFRLFKRGEISSIPHDPKISHYHDVIANDGKVQPVSIDTHEDIAVLQYTGGTTGVPKAAMLTHANLAANTMQSRLWFAPAKEGEEVLLAVLPFFHVFAMTVAMNLGILIGATLVILPRFDLAQVIKTIHRKRPTLFPAVPTIYAAISNYKNLKDYDLSSVKYCISGGAGLPVDVKRAFESVTGCVVAEGYGLSESSPVASCNPLTGTNKPGSIGLPLPRTVFQIVSLEDRSTLLPQGARGEVCLLGPQVMKGYWNNAPETAETLVPTPDGMRLHTGDVGYVDEEGYVYIVDRIKDMILCGGYKVYPRHVEEAVYLHPAVAECVVAGMPDPYRGQTVKAYVALKEGAALTKDELIAFLQDKISPIEMPKQVEFRAVLPKTLIGKLSRKALLDEEKDKAKV